MDFKKIWMQLTSMQKKDLLVKIGIPSICLASLLCFFKCSSDSVKEGLLARGGKLLLVDVSDEDKKIELEDSEGNPIKYDFNEKTLAVVSPTDDVTEKLINYEVMLFDEKGNYTFGYMKGKYLNDTVLDTYDTDKKIYETYYVNDLYGIILSSEDGMVSKSIENNNQVLATTLDNGDYRVLSIEDNKFVIGNVIGDKLSNYTNDLHIDEEKEKDLNIEIKYRASVPLNIRSDKSTSSDLVYKLNIGSEVKIVNGVEPFNDGNFEWVYVSYFNTNNNQEEEGWVAKKNFSTNEEYLVTVRDYSNMDVIANIKSEAAIALDVNTGQILFDKDAYSQRYPASITKVLTAYLVFKYGNLDDYLEYSNNAVTVEGHKNEGYGSAYTNIVSVGNKFSVRDAVYLSLLKSDNATTVALGEYVEKITGRKYTDLMNEEAHMMECKKCNFTNAYGYEDEEHHVSACDMAKITSYIVKNQSDVIDVMGTREYSFVYNGETYNLTNDSVIFNINEYAIGSKTGYTDAAGQTMITVFKKDGNIIVTVTLKGSGRDSKNLDADLLARSSFAKLESNTIAPLSYTDTDVKVKLLGM